MSEVLTTEQLKGFARGLMSYIELFPGACAQYRVNPAGSGVDLVIQRFIDALTNTDSAYIFEEYSMLLTWLDAAYGYAGRDGRLDDSSKSWLRSWKLHAPIPQQFLFDWPSPSIFVLNQIEEGHVPVLPQSPDHRKTIIMPDGSKRRIRVGSEKKFISLHASP